MIIRFDFFNLRWAAGLLVVLFIPFYLAPAEVKAADAAPQDPVIQKRLAEGIRLGKDGDYEQAIAEFKEILKLDPKNVHALNNIAAAYFKLKDVDKAASYFTNAVDLGVANSTTYFFRGIIFDRHRNDKAKAIKDFSKAIELEPNFSKAYLNRALVYSSLKKYDKSIADYNKIVKINPASLKTIIKNRATDYYKKGDHAKAWADVEKAKKLGVTIDDKFVEELKKARQHKQ